MKLNRFNLSPRTRVSHIENWLRHPGSEFPAFSQWLGLLPELPCEPDRTRIPADVFETPDAYYAQFELPGFRKEDVQVELDEQLLSLSAARKDAAGVNDGSTTLKRTVSVPQGVASEGISAKLENGILVVTLPKSPERKPKKIEVA